MTIAAQVARVSSDIAEREGKGDFLKLAHMLLRHKTAFNARSQIEAERCKPRVANILKSVVSGATLADWAAVTDYQNIVQAFQESLRTASVFDAVLADGMIRAPLRSRGLTVTTGITGAVVPEGQAKVNAGPNHHGFRNIADCDHDIGSIAHLLRHLARQHEINRSQGQYCRDASISKPRPQRRRAVS